MTETITKITRLLDFLEHKECPVRLLDIGPYECRRLREYFDGLFSLSRFKPGSEVRISVQPDFNRAPGWDHCRHFLQPWNKGSVRDVDFFDGQFVYHIEFDRESWIDRDGKERPVSAKHIFRFVEQHLQAWTPDARDLAFD